ncbi:hypothetical protein [Lysobacter enzymogenes]|uniref:hypothetical protein n=1 Tax=Lysobacter enzymogenes TaxID=69 RepID=UPI00099DDECD|nr:hypothetical protein [Lysobacter enzymogenes]QQQ00786.1 hypothetical protein JHW41_22410 [Lysobacter enzymogenes]UZW60245.1 hypothetical protein BV903_023710 [Lysobacter enzymogenes]
MKISTPERRNRSSRLSLVAMLAFAFAASFSATAVEPDCEKCKITYLVCLRNAPPLGHLVCSIQYSQCLAAHNCPASSP